MAARNEKFMKLQAENDRLKIELQETQSSLQELTYELNCKCDELVMAQKQIDNQKLQQNDEYKFNESLKLTRDAVHELAQPLTVLLGRCELLEQYHELQPVVSTNVKHIYSSARKIEEIIGKMREIKKCIKNSAGREMYP
jgi:signal transduction histidine kinase